MKVKDSNSESEILEPLEIEEEFESPADREARRARMVERLRILWRERRLLARVTLWGLVISTALAFVIPKRYESAARLMPPDPQSGASAALLATIAGGAGGSALGGFAGDLLGFKSSSALFVGILQSRTVQDRIVDQFRLMDVYGESRREDARDELADRTSISEDRKSGIVTVKVTDKSPQRAAAMAQAYVDELDRLVAEVSTSAARRERLFLEQRLKSVKDELDAAARSFSQFASKNAAIDIKEQGRAMVEAAAVLQGQLIAAEAELEGVREVYTENNVRVRAVRARIDELKRQLNKLGGADIGVTSSAAKGGVQSASLYPSIRELPLLGVTYADLFRRTKIAEVVYELLTRQYELARVQEAKEIPSVKVLDAAHVPDKKSFPPRTLLVLLGTVLACAGGIVWLICSAVWSSTDPKSPGRALASEVLDTVKADWPVRNNGSGIWSSVGNAIPRFPWKRKTRSQVK
ncbi:MAG: Wzz/FepE/Etk N-terminal domain-containing protein [Acidobacteriales bacterium]|nr:Wzz/FepE/Etk N-terminal domain-containing protein [Terriglobales bacterium]